MSTHREVGPRHGVLARNKEKQGDGMTDTIKTYTLNAACFPKSTLAWNVHRSITVNLGRSVKSVESQIAPTARNQLKVRVASVSLCDSDARTLCQSNTHPKLRSRDLRAKVIKTRIEPKQDSGVFEHLEANNETRVSTIH
jgi:hypothetical protein